MINQNKLKKYRLIDYHFNSGFLTIKEYNKKIEGLKLNKQELKEVLK